MNFSIDSLWVNGQRDNVLTDDATPVVALRFAGGVPEQVQLRLLTATDGQTIYDSGMTAFKSPFLTLPAVLQPKKDYTISVAAKKGCCVGNAQLTLHTGFMGAPWAGEWIEPEQESALPEQRMAFWENFIPRPTPAPDQDGEKLRCGQTLRRVFQVKGRPKQAILYATARGVYTPFLNGVRVGTARLAPEVTPYGKLLYYQRYDLTPYLKEGDNELRIELGDGWYVGRIGLSGSSCQYGDRLSFLGQIELIDEGNHLEVIGTDEQFESHPSKIVYSDLFIGEKWDLIHAPATWTACRKVSAPSSKLVAQPIPAITSGTPIPGTLLKSDDEETLVDFGQNLAGVVRLVFRTETHKTVILEHTEVLDREGNFYRNIIGRNKQQRDQISCGAGKHCFEPLHTYHGFRYVKITGLRPEEILSVDAVPINTPIAETGRFQCSHKGLNQLQHNIRWSMHSNFVSIPTDCPQREKMGWTGDVLAFATTGCFNAELLPVLSAWLHQMSLEQRENGEIPNIVPAFPIDDQMARENWGDNCSSAWGDACILVPFALYLATGNIQVLQDNLPMMEQWLKFVKQASESEGNPMLWTSGHHFGDWLIPSMAGTPERVEEGVARTAEITASAYRAITLDSWCKILDVLSKETNSPRLHREKEDAARLLTGVRQAVRETYVSPDGTVAGNLQGLYVTALRAGISNGTLRQQVADHLAALICENGCRLDTGFVSTPYLLDVLSENGYKDLAWKLLFQTKAPSWLYQVEHGATTIWENWSAIREDGTPTDSSMNHYALGAVGDWIYRNIGGIQAATPGWSQVRFAPDFSCGLEWSKCEKETAYGTVSCCWERVEHGIRVRLKTPVSAQWCQNGQSTELEPGEYEFIVSEGTL